MTNVLFIKANDRPADQSVSVQLYDAFVASYKQANPDQQVTEIDLYNTNLPYLNNTMITGMFKAARGIDMTQEEAEAAAIANGYLDQFIAADKVVFAFPLWNMTIPAVLHTYMDYLNQAGKTFRYTEQGPEGLLGGKQVIILNARGNVYSEGPFAASEMAVNYVENQLRFFGIQDIEKIIVEGHARFADQAAEIIGAGVEKAAATASSF
ncbi:FMN-dependent NADH-azoreductase [Paenibacillus kobensis]|uniref:FMN-dependent NADH-azoreductase n=1 Tax=Paenibacillus kobensis TaxID=59841 RepID=UPI000FD7A248|nr:FMN-dependent NADH-azoreductase [Paenibacillus kobensis]